MHSRDLLTAAAGHAADFLETLPERPRRAGRDRRRRAARARSAAPARRAERSARGRSTSSWPRPTPGLVASQSPRYFGFVIGGTLPAALAADWSPRPGTRTPALYVAAPAAAVVEEVAGGWLLDLLGLPADASFGLTTGCQMAHVTCLAAARHARPRARRLGRRGAAACTARRAMRAAGRRGAPRHVDRAAAAARLRHGALRAGRRRRRGRDATRTRCATALAAGDGPAIVCAQAGDVNTGAFDPLDAIVRRRCTTPAPGCTSTAPSACGPPRARAPRTCVAGCRARRLVGHRRPQVAQRPLRLRPGLRRATPRPTAPRWRQRRLPAARARAQRDAMRLDAGLLAPRARLRGLRGAALARARRRRRAGRALLRAARGASPRCSAPTTASRSSTTSCSTRCSCASATTTRRPTPWSPPCRPRARAG